MQGDGGGDSMSTEALVDAIPEVGLCPRPRAQVLGPGGHEAGARGRHPVPALAHRPPGGAAGEEEAGAGVVAGGGAAVGEVPAARVQEAALPAGRQAGHPGVVGQQRVALPRAVVEVGALGRAGLHEGRRQAGGGQEHGKEGEHGGWRWVELVVLSAATTQ
jgi:hypothetical protein